MRGGNINRKTFVFGAVILLLLTGLSPVYAELSFSESTSIKSITIETTNVDSRNPLERESFLDRYDSSEFEERYCNNPYHNRYHNPIRKPTVIDGVDGSWDIVVPDDYSTIQQAVNYAGEGYRIFVRAGTYKENVEIDAQLLTLHGEDREITIIDGNGNGNVIKVTSSADGVNVSGFALRNSGQSYAGINISSHYNVIQDNIITSNGNGIQLYLSSGNQIQNNQIKNNNGNGLWLYHSNGNTIIDNTFTENEEDGIEFTYSSLGTTVEDNTFSDNANCGILITESSLGNTIKGNTIKNNDVGVKCIGVSDGTILHHNNFIGNVQNAYDSSLDLWNYNEMGNYWDDYTGVDSNGDGIGDTPYNIPGGENKDRFPLMNPACIITSSKPEVRLQRCGRNSVGINTGLTFTITGTDDWEIIVPDDYPTIQEAVDHANDGYHILVKSGIYYENIVINKSFLTLHGESKYTVVIDGGGINHVVRAMEDAKGLNISGFTIRNEEKHFNGLYLWSDSALVTDIYVTGCNIAVAVRDTKHIIVRGNKLIDNNYGIWTWMCTNSILESNIIENNNLDGIAVQHSHVKITKNDITNNSFNGILVIVCSNNSVMGNQIDYNDQFGLQMFGSNYNLINDNTIENNSNGISLHKSENNIFKNNIVNSNVDSGLSLWYFSNGNNIDNNEIIDAWHGIVFNMVNHNFIRNNNITRNYNYGIYLRNSKNASISGNNVTFSFGGGIAIEESSEITVLGNYISNNGDVTKLLSLLGASGISLYKCHDISIRENTILNNIDGINLNNYCFNNTICNNTISKNKAAGIYIAYFCYNNIICGNTISNNKVFGICISQGDIPIGRNNVVMGNDIVSNTIGTCLLTFGYGTFIHNNFIKNIIHATFWIYFWPLEEIFGRWNENYWDNWKGEGWKIIVGGWLFYPYVSFDENPLKEPYDIGD